MSNRAFDPELMQQAQSNANRGNDCEVRLLILLSCSISLGTGRFCSRELSFVKY